MLNSRTREFLIILFLLIPLRAFANTIFADGLVHTVTAGTFSQSIIVDNSPSGSPTTLNWGGSAEALADIRALGDSRLSVSGGTIGLNLEAHGNPYVTISGGEIRGITTISTARLLMTGGAIGVGGIDLGGTTDLRILGGSVETKLLARSGTVATVSGGMINGQLQASEGTIIVVGGMFNFPLGEISPIAFGTLTGTLSDGSSITTSFSVSSMGTMRLVPEPSAGLLFASGLAVLAVRQRRTHI